MVAAGFFLIFGIIMSVNAHRRRALWFQRGAMCMILLAPVTYFGTRPDAHGTAVPSMLLGIVLIFCIVVGMARREQFPKAIS